MTKKLVVCQAGDLHLTTTFTPIEKEHLKEKASHMLANIRKKFRYLYTNIMKMLFQPERLYEAVASYDVRKALHDFNLKDFSKVNKSEIYQISIPAELPSEEITALKEFFISRGWQVCFLVGRPKKDPKEYSDLSMVPPLRAGQTLSLNLSKEQPSAL